jgi:integrase
MAKGRWELVEGWPGRVWIDARGVKTFHIRASRGGKRYDVSTRCRTLRAAMAELARFEADPDAYRAKGKETRATLTPALIERYRLWCEAKAPMDLRWLHIKTKHLGWWAEQLRGRPLDAVTLADIQRALAPISWKRDRIVALKHLYAFLRAQGLVEASDDPTLHGALPTPSTKPAQDTGPSKVIGEQDFRKVLPLLPAITADIVRVQAGTGLHLTEVLRGLKIEEPDVLVVLHKGGHVHRVQVPAQVVEAVKRLVAVGQRRIPGKETVYRHVREACAAAKVTPWTPGRFRHTFATRAVARGVNPQAVALALGHRSSATTLRWYSTTAVAPRVDGGIVIDAPSEGKVLPLRAGKEG